jgi:6-phosphogluconolactonase (cycloisomerase 2 family)
MPTARFAFGAARSFDSRIFAIGGIDANNTFGVVTNEAFTPPSQPEYVITGNTGLTVFGSAAGLLTGVPGSPFSTPAQILGIASDPTGWFVYAVLTSNMVEGFTIDATTGALSPIPGTPVAAGSVASAIKVHPSGQFLYVSNQNSLDVDGYGIDPTSGALSALPGSPYVTNVSGFDLAFDPAGAYAYVVSNQNGSVAVLSVNQNTGALTPVSGSPFPLGINLGSVAVHPNGEFVYASDYAFSGGNPGYIWGFQYNRVSGQITALPGSPYVRPAAPNMLSIDPTGAYLYAVSVQGNFVSGFNIDPFTGALTELAQSPFPAGNGPRVVAVDPMGQSVYVVDDYSPDMWTFSLNQQTGALAPIGSPVSTTCCSNVIFVRSAQAGSLPAPTVTFTGAPASAAYGAAFNVVATTNASTSAVITASGACSIAGATVTMTSGTGTCQLTANWAADSNYSAASATQSTAALQAVPAIAWPTPAAITYGTALSAAQLNATASVPGAFTYTPAAGTVLTAGSQTLSVIFTPMDTTDYTTATATTIIIVNKATPILTWPAPAAIAHGTPLSATQLDATASVPGTFVYTPSAGTVLPVGQGQVLSVAFTPSDSIDYPAASATVTINVTKSAPAITWANPASIVYGTLLDGTQLDAAATIPGTFVYTPPAGTLLPAGAGQILSVTFTPTDSTDYATATKTVKIDVAQATPLISWAAPAPIVYGTALDGTQLNATASVPGSFSYSPNVGVVLHGGVQTLSATFTPADAVDYSNVTTKVAITVNAATATIAWATPAAIVYGTALNGKQLDASASGPGTLTYSPAAGAVPTAGLNTLSVTFAPNNPADYTTATATVQLTVTQATPNITWANPTKIVYGTALSATQLNATVAIPGTFAYTPAAGTILPAGTGELLSVTFTPADIADYTSATATATISVGQATPLISWAAPAPIVYGTALGGTQLNATASVPGSFSYNPAAGAVLHGGVQTLSATFTPADAVDYSNVTTKVAITVNAANPILSWATPAPITSGTALSGKQLNAQSSAPGKFVYSPPAGTVLPIGVSTLSATFTPNNPADYNSATVSVQITVN